eukprot:TRINITY_DN20491_c0_g1_i2.p2 TRINITY_DN20491_c0_g1~~TRINITY_DN20491_c0_g1_i2.p2  ORF type:complete len:161 (-),score=47.86 TRINITY_DN20491_c0_g1_i2:135-617(-)
MRKAVKVRPGYTPPDEVRKFETRGSQFRHLRDNSTLCMVDNAPMSGADHMSKAQKKNAAKRKNKKAAAAGAEDAPANALVAEEKPVATKPVAEAPAPSALAPEEKELRKLSKKLREIEKLQSNVDAGTVPDETQLAKLAKRDEIQAQVDKLQAALESVGL